MALPRSATINCCGNPNVQDDNGQSVCHNCGAVHQESNIVSEIQFGENAAGAAIVQGSFIADDQTFARGQGPFRGGGGNESRERAVADAKRTINGLCGLFKINEHIAEMAVRQFTVAQTNNFTKGRDVRKVAACCLYVVCRDKRVPMMLIDFSDILKINVFDLGHTYLKMAKALHIRLLSLDPAIYIARFAKLLEFGKDTQQIIDDANRLVKRMNRDWIAEGRRPSGVAGAALIIAARMNNYRRSIKEMVYVVKVADVTIQKRLEEFKATDTSNLTVDEFRSVWLDQSHDPPSFNKKKRKRVRQVNEDGEVIPDAPERSEQSPEREQTPASQAPQLRYDKDGFAIPALPIDPALLQASTNALSVLDKGDQGPGTALNTPPATNSSSASPDGDSGSNRDPRVAAKEAQLMDIAERAIEDEITAITDNISVQHSSVIAEIEAARRAEQERAAQSKISDDPENFEDVDDDEEVNNMLLSEKESKIKENIWTEFNKDWIIEQEEKRLKAERDARNGIIKNPRKRRKVQRGNDPNNLPASPAESAKMFMKTRQFSRKINYDAIDHLFDDN